MIKVNASINFSELQADFTKLIGLLYFHCVDWKPGNQFKNHPNYPQWQNYWYYILYSPYTQLICHASAEKQKNIANSLLEVVTTKIEILQEQGIKMYVSFVPAQIPAKSPEISGNFYRVTHAKLHLATDFQTVPMLIDYDFYSDFYSDLALKDNYILPFLTGNGDRPCDGYHAINSFRDLGWIHPNSDWQKLQSVRSTLPKHLVQDDKTYELKLASHIDSFCPGKDTFEQTSSIFPLLTPISSPGQYNSESMPSLITNSVNESANKQTYFDNITKQIAKLTVEQKNIYSSDYLKMIDKIIDRVIENIKKHPRYNTSYGIQIEYAYNKCLPKNLLPTLVKKAQQCDSMMTNICAVIKNINMDKIEELDKLLTEFLLVNEYKCIAKHHVCVMFDIA